MLITVIMDPCIFANWGLYACYWEYVKTQNDEWTSYTVENEWNGKNVVVVIISSRRLGTEDEFVFQIGLIALKREGDDGKLVMEFLKSEELNKKAEVEDQKEYSSKNAPRRKCLLHSLHGHFWTMCHLPFFHSLLMKIISPSPFCQYFLKFWFSNNPNFPIFHP